MGEVVVVVVEVRWRLGRSARSAGVSIALDPNIYIEYNNSTIDWGLFGLNLHT